MVCFIKFTIEVNQMYVNIPHTDCMGSKHVGVVIEYDGMMAIQLMQAGVLPFTFLFLFSI